MVPHRSSTHISGSAGSSSRDCTNTGRMLTASASSEMRDYRFADRTAANVATPSTSVPPAVASDAIVDQSAMRDEPRAADLAHPMTWSGD